MPSNKQEQDELLSYIDGIIACLEQYPTLNIETPTLDNGVAVNAMSLLMMLLGKFCTEEELIKWLAKFLVTALPALEVGVKGVILSNLKLSISCNVDPWIPKNWRQKNNNNDLGDETRIPIQVVDYRNLLQISPLSKLGQQYYNDVKLEYIHENPTSPLITKKVGSSYLEVYNWVIEQQRTRGVLANLYDLKYISCTGDIKSIYELVRANDMNAFLWFVCNKGNYGKVQYDDIQESKINSVLRATKPHDISTTDVNYTDSGEYSIYTNGDIVSTKCNDNKSENFLICYDGQKAIGKDKFSYYSKLVPCSNKKDSYNWYVDRKKFARQLTNGKIKGDNKIKRNYNDEFPICNFSFGNGLINMKVLNQPFLHYPKDFWMFEKNQEITPFVPFQKILFNADGEQDPKGNFTVYPISYNENGKIKLYEYDEKTETYTYQLKSGFTLKVNKFGYDSENINSDKERFINDCLIPCYKGLTVYEFNYDFVMGMHLFDPKTVAFRIINTLTSGFISAGAQVTMTEQEYEARISSIIKDLIESDAYEVSECFFSFSNEKYQTLLDEAVMKRSKGYTFQNENHGANIDADEVMNILNEYSSESTLNEQKDIFTRAFNNVTASIKEETLGGDVDYNITKEFMMDSIKVLGVVIFETLISPKMLLLFEMNRRLMGDFTTSIPTLKKLLIELSTLITTIIAEFMNLILSELLALAMSKIDVLLEKLTTMVSIEQLRFYRELINKLIKACSFKFPLYGHRANLETQLDVVQYADIDEIEQPQTDNC